MNYEWPVNVITSTRDCVRPQFAQPHTTQIWTSKEVETHISGYSTLTPVTEKECLLTMQQKRSGHMQAGGGPEDFKDCIAIFLLYYLSVPGA